MHDPKFQQQGVPDSLGVVILLGIAIFSSDISEWEERNQVMADGLFKYNFKGHHLLDWGCHDLIPPLGCLQQLASAHSHIGRAPTWTPHDGERGLPTAT
jgi:hypothetical protein